MKGLKIEDKLDTANSKSRNESEVADSVEQFGSDKPNYLKAKWAKEQ